MSYLLLNPNGRVSVMFFTSKKKRDRLEEERRLERDESTRENDKAVEAIKVESRIEVEKSSAEIQLLNQLVKKHGIGGLIFFSTGKGRK